jgi:hypothetical protein
VTGFGRRRRRAVTPRQKGVLIIIGKASIGKSNNLRMFVVSFKGAEAAAWTNAFFVRACVRAKGGVTGSVGMCFLNGETKTDLRARWRVFFW